MEYADPGHLKSKSPTPHPTKLWENLKSPFSPLLEEGTGTHSPVPLHRHAPLTSSTHPLAPVLVLQPRWPPC